MDMCIYSINTHIRADTGAVIKIIEELNVLTIDISDFLEKNIEYNVTVSIS